MLKCCVMRFRNSTTRALSLLRGCNEGKNISLNHTRRQKIRIKTKPREARAHASPTLTQFATPPAGSKQKHVRLFTFFTPTPGPARTHPRGCAIKFSSHTQRRAIKFRTPTHAKGMEKIIDFSQNVKIFRIFSRKFVQIDRTWTKSAQISWKQGTQLLSHQIPSRGLQIEPFSKLRHNRTLPSL